MAKFKRGVPRLKQILKRARYARPRVVAGNDLPKIYAPLKNRVTTERGKHFVKSILYFTIINGEEARINEEVVSRVHQETWGKAGWKERQAVALRRVCEVIGDKREEDLTAEDFALYLIKRYGAKEVSFEECLPYLEDPEEYAEDEDPVSVLTENWINTETARIFILPARTKSYFNLCRQREGLIFYMGVKEDGKVYRCHWDEGQHADAFNWYPYLCEEEQLFTRNYVRIYGG